MIVVLVLAMIALFAAAVGVFFDYALHDRYAAWWKTARTGVRQGLDGFYQERGW